MKKLNYIILFLFAFCLQRSAAQTKKTDSLLLLLKPSVHDTTQVNIMNLLSSTYEDAQDYKKAREFATKALTMAKELNDKSGTAWAMFYLGYLDDFEKQQDCIDRIKMMEEANKMFVELGDKKGSAHCHLRIGTFLEEYDYTEALKNYETALKLCNEIGDKKMARAVYGNSGNVYEDQGNYPMSLKKYYTALKLAEEERDTVGIAATYNNIGIVKMHQNEYIAAKQMYLKAISMKRRIHDTLNIHFSNMLDNMGIIHYYLGSSELAMDYMQKALKVREALHDVSSMGSSYGNIGSLYQLQGKYDEAMSVLEKGVKLNMDIGDKKGAAIAMKTIAQIMWLRGQKAESGKKLEEALRLAEEVGHVSTIQSIYKTMTEADTLSNDYKSALADYKKFIFYRDSLFNQDKTRKSVEAQMRYVFDKKQTADSLNLTQERAINDLKFVEEKKQRKYLYVGLFFILVFAGVMFNRFKVTQKQKKVIELKERETQYQKELIEEKQKEILDSIHYAKRIQRSLLPTEKYIERKMKELNRS